MLHLRILMQIEDELENNAEDYFNPDTGELLLGDIVLCVQKIKEQATSMVILKKGVGISYSTQYDAPFLVMTT